MAWRTVQTSDVLLRFQHFELATWQNIETGSGEGVDPDAGISVRLANAVAAFVAAMEAAGYRVLRDGSVPDQLREDILSYAAWQWQLNFPGQRATEEFKTDPRRQAYKDAVAALEKIRNLQYGNIEDPYGQEPQTANWNSQPKLLMRMSPLPLPTLQWQGDNIASGGPGYANPGAMGDGIKAAIPQLHAPLNVQAQGGDGKVTVSWQWVPGATSFLVFRGTGPGLELAAPVATLTGGTLANYWQDTSVTDGTVYYYQVKAANGNLVSNLSDEASAKPNPGPSP